MHKFANIYKSILAVNKVSSDDLLLNYFSNCSDNEKKLIIQTLLGLPYWKTISSKHLVKLTLEHSQLPEWLVKESHAATADWVETCSLIVGNPHIEKSNFSLADIIECISTSNTIDQYLINLWPILSIDETWVLNKLVTGTLKNTVTKNEIAKVLSVQYKISQELVALRLCYFDLQDFSFDDLINKDRNEIELFFQPHHFITANDWTINFNHELISDYIIQPFVYGERKIVMKFKNRMVKYLKSGDWSKVKDAKWQDTLPDKTKIEFIEQEDSSKLIYIHLWEGNEVIEYNSQLEIMTHLTEAHSELSVIDSIHIESWAHLSAHQNSIIKHRYDPARWYRIKPPAKSLMVVLWYAELNSTNTAELISLSFALKNQKDELVSIAKCNASDLSASDQTGLYFWIQNNTIKKSGPVRTVRPLQYFKIEYDRAIISKKTKSGVKLMKVKIIDWKRNERDIVMSSIHEIITDD